MYVLIVDHIQWSIKYCFAQLKVMEYQYVGIRFKQMGHKEIYIDFAISA